MKTRKIWLNFSIFNLCMLAFLGMVLRSKAVFEIPFIDFNHLADAHGHFAFGAWVTLSLSCLLVSELLPQPFAGRKIYQWLFGCIIFTSWVILFSYTFQGNSIL